MHKKKAQKFNKLIILLYMHDKKMKIIYDFKNKK